MKTYTEEDLREIHEEGACAGIAIAYSALVESGGMDGDHIKRIIESARKHHAELASENFARAQAWLRKQKEQIGT
jgi:hypothetical protein